MTPQTCRIFVIAFTYLGLQPQEYAVDASLSMARRRRRRLMLRYTHEFSPAGRRHRVDMPRISRRDDAWPEVSAFGAQPCCRASWPRMMRDISSWRAFLMSTGNDFSAAWHTTIPRPTTFTSRLSCRYPPLAPQKRRSALLASHIQPRMPASLTGIIGRHDISAIERDMIPFTASAVQLSGAGTGRE